MRTLPLLSFARLVGSCLVGSVCIAGLGGCGAGDVLATDVPAAAQVTMTGGFQGSNFGGHAPIVGAKVFLLQAGTSGYGSKSTSLLTSAAGGTDTSVVGSAGTPAYYATTDGAGYFNISGDYTCTAGLPVYLYAYAGAPDSNPAVGYATISYASYATSAGVTTYTFTVDEEKFYVGQQVTFNTVSGVGSGLSNQVETVSAISTTGNNSFSVVGPTLSGSGAGGAAGTVYPTGAQNPAIVNVAVLGNCPTSAPYTFGTGSSEPINFVFMNEVSTAAAMFALAPFAETSTTSGGVVTRTGTDAQHIGIPASDTLALTGIQNAANNAGQLYDITGATNNVSSNNGDAHNARTVVPGSGAGKGVATVPQALIDTLGNILASCVDSPNTAGLGATGGTYSTQCNTLFSTATADGTTTGAKPTDIATAAINIAHYPAGNGNANFVSNLYNLPTGLVPFTPVLAAQPTDFMIGINITVPQGTNPTNYLGSSGTTPAAAIPTAIATDAYGDAYVGTTGCGSGGAESSTNGYGCVLQILPTQLLPGLPTVSGVGFAQGVRSIALGPAGKLWATGLLETGQTVSGYTPPAGAFYIVVNAVSPSAPLVTGASSTTQAFAAFGNTNVGGNPGSYTSYYSKPTAIAVNGNAHAYIADFTNNYLHDITGVNTSPSYTTTNTDSEYLIQGAASGANINCEANITALAIGNLTPATTANGSGAYNIWTASSAGTLTQGMCTMPDPAVTSLTAQTGNTQLVNTVTPVAQLGAQYSPTSVAVDANDVAWDTNTAVNNEVAEGFPNNGSTYYNTDYGFAASSTTTPTGIAIDGNDNLWVTNNGSNSVSAYTNLGISSTTGRPSGVAISPAGTGMGNGNGGYTAGSTISGPAAIAIDLSGDVWVANTSSTGVGYSVTELIGAAAPTYSGLAAARAANKLGMKP